jgi:hypothetical protein
MMQAAQHRYRHDRADWLAHRKSGAFLVEGKMRPRLVIIGRLLFQDAAQVRLAEHDHVIEAFTAN